MSARQRRRLAAALTPVLAELFGVPADGWGNLNIRFHAYRPHVSLPSAVACCRTLVPPVGRVLRRLAS